MDFNSFRKEINNKNASVKELVNEFFLKIDARDSEINSFINSLTDAFLLLISFLKELKSISKVAYKY